MTLVAGLAINAATGVITVANGTLLGCGGGRAATT
jgi:hypothetical protein